MRIEELDDATTKLAYPAMKELRPHLADVAEFVDRVAQQRTEGYRLVAAFDEAGEADEAGQAVAVAGFRRAHCLAMGHYLYIDDLVTLPEARGKGCAGALLRWVDAEARRLGCDEVHLDSGTHRHTAHRLYLNHGFHIPALHFGKSC